MTRTQHDYEYTVYNMKKLVFTEFTTLTDLMQQTEGQDEYISETNETDFRKSRESPRKKFYIWNFSLLDKNKY